MAYDEGLAEGIRGVLDERGDVAEKRMFGGLAFVASGHLGVGIVEDDKGAPAKRPARRAATKSRR